MPSRRIRNLAPLGLLIVFLIAMLAQVAAATVFEDFADNLALKLDTSQAAAGALLGTGVLVAIGFALARLELDVIGIAIVLLAVVGALILIGWMYVWVLILAGLLVAYMVAERMRNPYGG